MMSSDALGQGPERYDVAFSFLEADLAVAKELRDLLEPGLTCFVYTERQEEVGGGDGLTSLARVFKEDARLTVILLRPEWGQTRWTAAEEAAIKERALDTGFRSFMVVAMEQGISLPKWIPSFMIYQHGWREPRSETAAVIRARAGDAGAVLKTETALDVARRLASRRDTLAQRAEFLTSRAGCNAARAEALALFKELSRLIDAIAPDVPDLGFTASFETVNPSRIGGVIQGGDRKLALWWEAPIAGSLRNARLEVGVFLGSHRDGWYIYRFGLDDDGVPGWQYERPYEGEGGLLVLRTSRLDGPVPTLRFADEQFRRLVHSLLPHDA